MMGRRRQLFAAAAAVLVAACGGSPGTATTVPGASTTGATTTQPAVETTTTTLDPYSLEAMLDGLDAQPEDRTITPGERLGGAPDYAAATAIAAEVEAAMGVSISGIIEIWVFPVIGSGEVLLILDIPAEAADVTDDLPEGFLPAVVEAASASEAAITHLVMLFSGSDELGDFVMTMLLPWDAARAFIIEGADVADRLQVQLTREGRVVDR